MKKIIVALLILGFICCIPYWWYCTNNFLQIKVVVMSFILSGFITGIIGVLGGFNYHG